MYLTLIILPLLGSIISGFFGRKVGVSGSQIITCLCISVTTFLALIVFSEVGLNNITLSILIFRWIDTESLNVLWSFQFDSLTVSMLIPVLIVSLLVHIYSIGYMSHDPHNQRFFSYLSLFTFMMIILVTANNFLLMFVGWEGVGVCSYLLVSFWFTRIAANQSSLSAFLTNRVGDWFLTIGMFAVLWSFGDLDYSTVFSLAPYVNENIVTIIGTCLLIGATAKSSQIGLHVWLPMAMEGPTPVSALIHAATMVTAGVYLLMRTSPLIEYSSTVLVLCLWIGAITTVFSSLIGLFQQDIKKVIAYSTMSQLGMMVIAIGLSSYNIALFHLINHAFYKGLLFLGAGAVIHALADNQDFRKYGGLGPFLPLTYSVILIASLSLVAFPFMTGFYSKDLIIESSYGQFSFYSTVVYSIATIGAMFTTLYSVKVLYLTFLTNPNGPLIYYNQTHEGNMFMSVPLILLALLSIFFGYLTKDIFIGLGSGFFSDNSLFIHPTHEIMLDTEFAVSSVFKLLPLVFTISLSVISIVLSEFLPNILVYFKFSSLGYNIFSFFNLRFFIELLYNKYITDVILKLGGQTTKILDKGSIELIGPYGLEIGLLYISKIISNLDAGIVTYYALYILIGFIFYILTPYLISSDNSLFLLILISLIIVTAKFSNSYISNSLIKSIQINQPYFRHQSFFLCPILFMDNNNNIGDNNSGNNNQNNDINRERINEIDQKLVQLQDEAIKAIQVMPKIIAKLENGNVLTRSDKENIKSYCDADVDLDNELLESKRILADSIKFANKETIDTYYNLDNKLQALQQGLPEPESKYPSESESNSVSDSVSNSGSDSESSSKAELNKDENSSKPESSSKAESLPKGDLNKDESSSKAKSSKDESSSKPEPNQNESSESSSKGKSKEQGSIFDDLDPNLEMPDFFDPDG